MATKWDPLVLKYERLYQQELGKAVRIAAAP